MSEAAERTLRLPDGVRLPERKEIKGPRAERDRLWARVERACLRPGYVVRATTSAEFGAFVEANVDADQLGAVFADLARAVCGAEAGDEPPCRLLLADAEEELAPVGEATLPRILGVLAVHPDPLLHDGWIHFGVVCEHGDTVSAVLVTPTKHLQIWARSLDPAIAVLDAAGLRADHDLAFLAEFPVIAGLPEGRDSIGVEELRRVLAEGLGTGD